MLGLRDQVALAGIRGTTQNLARVLGANHVPGIGAGLEADGFILEQQIWHSMLRPSHLEVYTVPRP